jgi:hypothetical protein
MDQRDGIRWFKTQFGAKIADGFKGTPFTVDMAAAIAVQETFSDCWGLVYKTKPVDVVLRLCVGDTLDFPNRKAFPRERSELTAEAFDVARQALLDIAQFNHAYAKAAENHNKFCHGYGIFQYDIQFIKEDPDFFIKRGWHDFDQCLAKLIKELKAAMTRAYGPHKASLTDDEMMYVAIAYNAGHVVVGGGPKQGFKDGEGRFYGENFQKFLAMAHTVEVDGVAAHEPPPVFKAPPGHEDLAVLLQHVLALMQPKPAPGPSPAPQPPLSDQTDQLIRLLTMLKGGQLAPLPIPLGPVNGALGDTIGNLLNGRKSALGIIGAMITSVLQAVGPTLATQLPLVGSFAGLGQAALPIFLAMAVWGVLGKMEKAQTAAT